MKYYFLTLFFIGSFLQSRSQNKVMLPVADTSGKWGYIDGSGKQIIPCQFDMVYGYYNGYSMFAIEVNGAYKFGFIDEQGNLIEQPAYDNGYNFSDGVSWLVERDNEKGINRYFLTDGKGSKEQLSIQYTAVKPFADGMAAVQRFGNWGFVNKDLKEIIKPQFKAISVFSGGLCGFGTSDDTLCRWGYINKAGQEVIKPVYASAYPFAEGMAAVNMHSEAKKSKGKTEKISKWGYISGNGEVIIPFSFDEAESFSNGLAKVKLDNRFIFINTSGKMVHMLDSGITASSYHDELALVNDGTKVYFINKAGEQAINLNFVDAGNFNNGFAWVVLPGNIQAYIDTKGNIIWQSKSTK